MEDFIIDNEIAHVEAGQFREDVARAFDYAGREEALIREELRSIEFDGLRPFEEIWEHDFQDYSHRFRWCCHAIEWAIDKYDESKEATP